jgi:hypothetical protein
MTRDEWGRLTNQEKLDYLFNWGERLEEAVNSPLPKSCSNQPGSATTAMARIANPSGDAATRMIVTACSV